METKDQIRSNSALAREKVGTVAQMLEQTNPGAAKILRDVVKLLGGK